MNIEFLNNISSKDKNYLLQIIPELQEFEFIIENNECHKSESVLDHTLCVFDNFNYILDNIINLKYKDILEKKITKNKIKSLLRFAILLHDIGKKDCLIIKDNKTFFPNHEKIGAESSKKTIERFNFDKEESSWMKNIIEFHTEIHKTLDGNKKDFNKKYKTLTDKFPNMHIEFTILGLADILNSHLQKSNYSEYKRRTDLLINKLN